VVVHDITNPYVAALVRGVQGAAKRRWVSLYLAGGSTDVGTAVANLGARVDGIICAATTEGSPVLEALRLTRKPTVIVEFEPTDMPHEFDVVVLDNAGGARAAVAHLIELGHRRIGVIAGPDTISVGRERLLGARQAAEQAGGDVELVVEPSAFDFDGGYQATARLLGGRQGPTAVFAPNNLTAMGSLHLLHDLGVRVPDDLSFIGFDPLPSSELFVPPPSFVDRPESEQGALAMRLLDSRIDGRGPADPRRIVLDAKLVDRGTTAPPPRAG
jgi:DNA-binding LacI/PurR family transcriptional regulator